MPDGSDDDRGGDVTGDDVETDETRGVGDSLDDETGDAGDSLDDETGDADDSLDDETGGIGDSLDDEAGDAGEASDSFSEHVSDAAVSTDASGVIHFQFDPSEKDPVFDVVNAVAALEDRDVTDVPPLHEVVDHVLDDVFSTPPVRSAGLRVEFTYAGYRIDLRQDGRATFVKVPR